MSLVIINRDTPLIIELNKLLPERTTESLLHQAATFAGAIRLQVGMAQQDYPRWATDHWMKRAHEDVAFLKTLLSELANRNISVDAFSGDLKELVTHWAANP